MDDERSLLRIERHLQEILHHLRSEREGSLPQIERNQHAILHQLRGQRVRHGWLRFVVHDLETNPHTQYRVHLIGVVYWLVNFPLVAALYLFEPAIWLQVGVFITLVYSIYANLATDYGSMSAAMAAFDHPLPEIPGQQFNGEAH